MNSKEESNDVGNLADAVLRDINFLKDS